ncbi:MAG: TPM domain-containing protein [Hyphomicrobium sp.]|jgi:putative membrane protein|uniref:TPM domain-containing protein n=1 Tax=Hyphomicrobium sp. TaxID=82 RepID=UPI0025BCA42B|nr:TPM domain-containing protein [Hyphomicrobium sp.]MBX9863690.1 TPM domain-containing protein [Hyphomicrobium sp.]
MRLTFSETDEHRIAEAITNAERKTSGEIVAVVSSESSTYLYAPFLWASVAALLTPWPLILWTWWPASWVYLAQVAVFAAVLLLTLPRPIRYRLVPARVKRARAHRRAMEQFVAQNLHTTAGRTGVLIFVSVAERHAEIIADTAIDGRVPKGTWKSIVARLTGAFGNGQPVEGFVTAIDEVGAHLATHFPPGSCDVNELPDHLIVLDGV